MFRVYLILLFLFFSSTAFSQNTLLITKSGFGDSTFVDSAISKQNILVKSDSDKLDVNAQSVLLNVFFISILLLFAFTSIKFRKEISDIFKSFFNYNFYNSLLNSRYNTFTNIINVLNLFFFLFLALLFYFLLENSIFLNIKYKLVFIPISFFVFTAFYFLKLLFVSIFQYFFELNRFTQKYSLNIKISNSIASLILMFFLFLFVFQPQVNSNKSLLFSVIVILSVYLVRIFNILKEFFSKGILLFYVFLYLCTVEFFPVLFILKFLFN